LNLQVIGTIPASGARTIAEATGCLDIPAGQGLQIRSGSLADPVTQLQEVCPAGKAWHVDINVTISQVDV